MILEDKKELALHNAVEFPPINFTEEDFVTFSKLAVEEIMRRSIKRDSQAYTKEQILDRLMPGWKEYVQEYKT